MNIEKLIKFSKKPDLYEKGTHNMWTDDYISKQLLHVHLNPDIDLASRKEESIDKTLNWIISQYGKESGDILDLGCGPGLYTAKLAEKSYNVTGIDFSSNSISYAKKTAKEKKLNINYICENYLNLNMDNKFDLIIMIYCDFGVLSFKERELLLSKIHRLLKPNGIFIFDSLNENAIEKIDFNKSWEIAENGFWSETPYVALSETFHYSENRAILSQHILIEESEEKNYRFWNHYFNDKDINNIIKKFKFYNYERFENLIDDDGITFYKVKK